MSQTLNFWCPDAPAVSVKLVNSRSFSCFSALRASAFVSCTIDSSTLPSDPGKLNVAFPLGQSRNEGPGKSGKRVHTELFDFSHGSLVSSFDFSNFAHLSS